MTLLQKVSASALIVVPLAGLAFAMVRLWSHGIGWFDLILAVALYIVTGHGLTIGFHRYLAHQDLLELGR